MADRRGMMLILSSPSGAGKTTLTRMLLARYGQKLPSPPSGGGAGGEGSSNNTNASDALTPALIPEGEGGLTLSISVTTRPMRPGEEEGRDYFFVDKARFNAMAGEGELLEHAEVFDNYYGTPVDFVESHIESGTDIIFDIDWQGTRQLAEKRRIDMVSIFILPPSMKELERRLRARNQDSEAVVKSRMEKAASEISHWQEYDYVLVNDDREKTLQTIDQIFQTERLKRLRQNWLEGFVASLS